MLTIIVFDLRTVSSLVSRLLSSVGNLVVHG